MGVGARESQKQKGKAHWKALGWVGLLHGDINAALGPGFSSLHSQTATSRCKGGAYIFTKCTCISLVNAHLLSKGNQTGEGWGNMKPALSLNKGSNIRNIKDSTVIKSWVH